MKKSLLLAGAAFLSCGVYAQTDVDQEPTGFVDTEKYTTIYEILEENGPQHPAYRNTPRFTLIGKDNKFYLGMGANLKFVADYDWGHPVSNPNEFAPSDIPMSVAPGDGGKTQFSIGQSNFYLNFVALPGTSNQLGIFIDINFLGADAKAVALHHAYLKYRGITAGYVVSTFTDLAAEPPAIDFAGPNAITFVRHPNISYNVKFGKDRMWSAQIGLDMPEMKSADLAPAASSAFVSQRMPDIPLFIQRSWAGGKGWLRASFIFRDLYYRDLMHNKNCGELGWGVKLSGKTPICGGLSAYYQGVYGKGVSSYIQDLSGEGLDLVPTIGNDGKLQTVKSWGAYGTLRYDFCPKVFMDVTYSHVRAYTPDNVEWADGYRYGQYVTGNLFYKINSFTQCGLEYLWGRRVNQSGRQAHDNRLMFMLQVSI